MAVATFRCYIQQGMQSVRSIPNILRRGNTFHFRRAVPTDLRPLLGRKELTRSLETGDTRDARIRSRQLYIASEALFDAIRDTPAPMLTQQQLAQLVQTFYEIVLSEDAKARLRQGVISEEQRQLGINRHDQVAKACKDALARNDFDAINFVTDFVLSKHKLIYKLNHDELAQVRQAMLRAGIDAAEHLKARYEGDFNHEPRDKLLKVLAEQVDFGHLSPGNRQETPQPEATLKANKAPCFAQLYPKFKEHQVARGHWKAQSAAQNEKSFELFLDICGDRPICDYTKQDAGTFKEKLEQLPWNYGKAAIYRGKRVTEIIAISKRLPADQKERLVDARTVQRHFSALSALWDYAAGYDYVPQNFFKGYKFGPKKRADQQRKMWEKADLKALFATPVWRGCQSAVRRTATGREIIRDSKFWIPLIAVFSGMRVTCPGSFIQP